MLMCMRPVAHIQHLPYPSCHHLAAWHLMFPQCSPVQAPQPGYESCHPTVTATAHSVQSSPFIHCLLVQDKITLYNWFFLSLCHKVTQFLYFHIYQLADSQYLWCWTINPKATSSTFSLVWTGFTGLCLLQQRSSVLQSADLKYFISIFQIFSAIKHFWLKRLAEGYVPFILVYCSFHCNNPQLIVWKLHNTAGPKWMRSFVKAATCFSSLLQTSKKKPQNKWNFLFKEF